jgi:Cu(I)/Ag(I) efflux system membrane fusion protein
MKLLLSGMVLIAIGIAIGFGISGIQQPMQNTSTTKEKDPLYWVAPMDSSFRRDSPGKSSMGMDLVPVYGDDTIGEGVIKVSPNVEHNLGVKTQIVRMGLMQSEIITLADVQYNEGLMVNVYPRVEGWVEKLFVKSVGESVHSGQALYEIYSPELVNAQQEMITAVTQGNKMLIVSARARLESLQVPGADITRLEKRGSSQNTAKRTVTVFAPRSGIVSLLGIREGNFVRPSTQIMAIAGLESVWITTDIFENDVANINLGDSITFEFDSLVGVKITTTVDFISPLLEKTTRTLEIRSTVMNDDGLLRANMYAKAIIRSQSMVDLLLAPKNAVIRTASQNRIVMKLGDGQYKSVAVQLGRINATQVEILQGLVAGDEVVVQAQFLLDSESSVSSDFVRMGMLDTQSDMKSEMSMDGSGMKSMQMDMSPEKPETVTRDNP